MYSENGPNGLVKNKKVICFSTALSSINGLVSLKDGKLNRELVGSMYPEKFAFEKIIDSNRSRQRNSRYYISD